MTFLADLEAGGGELPVLPAPSDEDIARLERAVCRKVTRYLGQLTGEGKEISDSRRCSRPMARAMWRGHERQPTLRHIL